MMGPCIMQDLGNNDLRECLRTLTRNKTKKVSKEVVQQIDSREITIILRQNFEVYIQDIENCTGRKMPQKQRDLITDYVNNNRIFRLSPSSDKSERRAFGKIRAQLREEWEKQTGQKWPSYEEDVKDGKGKVIRRKGQPYDAHHIVELSYGGPNVWYNLFPAKHPDEHQQGIHGEYSVASQIFIEENRKPKMARKKSVEIINEPEGEVKIMNEKKRKRKLVLKKIN